MLRLRLIGSALLATGLLLPAVPSSAYYTAGSVSVFGASGTTQLPYTTGGTTQTTGASGSTTVTTTSGTTQVTYTVGGSVTYFGTTPQIVYVSPQTPTSSGGQTTQSQGGSPIIYWNVASQTPPATTSPILFVTPPTPGAGTVPANEQALITQFLAMVNRARAQAGAGPLTENPVLGKLAMAKAQDLATYNYFDHYSPRLGWPINQEQAAGFRAYSMGPENLAEAADITRAFAMLMASPLHHENLVNTAFTQTGIAIVPVYGGVLVDEFFTGPNY